MKQVILLLCFASACVCDYSERPRNFSLELLYHSQAETNGHIMMAPFGIWTLMMGVGIGAVGKSFTQIQSACRLSSNKDKWMDGYKKLTDAVLNSSEIALVNRNFLFLEANVTVEEGFRTIIEKDFGVGMKWLNFSDLDSATKLANDYIQKTVPLVSKVLIPGDFFDAQMILTNIFIGHWQFPFNKANTKQESFYDENGKVIGKVNMMKEKGQFPYTSIKELGADVVEIPYLKDKKYSMLVLLPFANVKLVTMYHNMAKVTLSDIVSRIQFNGTDKLTNVEVGLPRLKISSNLVLNKPLKKMGIYDIFEPNLADLAFVSRKKIFVSSVVHKADIQVIEDETTISKSTAASPTKVPTFIANRPFVYFIMEKSTTTVIFGGVYSMPAIH